MVDAALAVGSVLTPHRLRKATSAVEKKTAAKLARLFQARLEIQRKAIERLVRSLGLGAGKKTKPVGDSVEKAEKQPTTKEIMAALKAEIAKPIEDAFRSGIVGGAKPVAQSLGVGFKEHDPAVSEFLDDHMTNLEFVLDEVTAETVKEMIREGYEDGEGEEGLIARIRGATDFSEARSQRIARTESHIAVMHGANEAMVQAGVDQKEWLSAGDDRVRESHVEANGQVVDAEDKFEVGDAELAYPGDPEGGWDHPGEVIGCRCTTLARYRSEKSAAQDAFAKALGLEGDAMARELAREAVSWIPDAVLTGARPDRYLKPLRVRDGSGGEESYRVAKADSDVAELVLGPYASPDQVAIQIVKHAVASLMTDAERDDLVDELDDVGFDVDEERAIDVIAAVAMGLAAALANSVRSRVKKVDASGATDATAADREIEIRRAAIVAQQYFFVASPLVRGSSRAGKPEPTTSA